MKNRRLAKKLWKHKGKVAAATLGTGAAIFTMLNSEQGSSKSSGFVGSIEAGATEITQSAVDSLANRDESILSRTGTRDSFAADRALGGIR